MVKTVPTEITYGLTKVDVIFMHAIARQHTRYHIFLLSLSCVTDIVKTDGASGEQRCNSRVLLLFSVEVTDNLEINIVNWDFDTANTLS